jgi:hypothetical protein
MASQKLLKLCTVEWQGGAQGVSAGPVIMTRHSARLPSSTRTNTEDEKLSGSVAYSSKEHFVKLILFYFVLFCL